MVVKVYMKDKKKFVPELFEDYETGLYATVNDAQAIKDIGTDYDVVADTVVRHRYSKEMFNLFIEGGEKNEANFV